MYPWLNELKESLIKKPDMLHIIWNTTLIICKKLVAQQFKKKKNMI